MKLQEEQVELQKNKTGKDLGLSLGLHALIIGGILGSGFIFRNHGTNWGEHSDTAGAIQATMVNSIPLPPRQPTDDQNVLATETPSPAPETNKEKTEPPPSPTDIPIPVKQPPKTPPKVAEKPTPVQHPQPVKQQPDRATTGESSGVRIAMTSAETKLGTASINVTDGAFGQRFAYYVRGLTQEVAKGWYTQTLDSGAYGRRVWITFRVNRDGSFSDSQIARSSGDPGLDQSALRALQRVDHFAPLPQEYTGSYINVQYYFEPKPQQ